MDINNFGKVLKKVRIGKGLSQRSLAEGICTEKFIYLIEAGKRLPSAYILELLSMRLNTNLNKLLILSTYEDPIAINQIKASIDVARKEKEVHKLKKGISYLEEQPIREPYIEQFLLWNKAIVAELDESYHEAQNLCLESLAITRGATNLDRIIKDCEKKFIPSMELDILSTLTCIIFKSGDTDIAIHICKVMLRNMEYYFEKPSENEIYNNLLYNTSYFLSHSNRKKEALTHLNRLIYYSDKKNRMDQLEQKMYFKSILLYEVGMIECSKKIFYSVLLMLRAENRLSCIAKLRKQVATEGKYISWLGVFEQIKAIP